MSTKTEKKRCTLFASPGCLFTLLVFIFLLHFISDWKHLGIFLFLIRSETEIKSRTYVYTQF